MKERKLHNKIVFDLISKIEYYYSNQTSINPNEYTGNRKLLEIYNNKAKFFGEKNLKNWTNLIAESNLIWENETVLDLSAVTFPSYKLEVILPISLEKNIKKTTSIHLDISLLIPKIALFVYSHIYELDSNTENYISKGGIISNSTNLELNFQNKFEKFEKILLNIFSSFRIIDNFTLFKQTSNGYTPFSVTYEEKIYYTIYDFLFSNTFLQENYIVIS